MGEMIICCESAEFKCIPFFCIKVDVVGGNSVVSVCVSMADLGYLFVFVWQ